MTRKRSSRIDVSASLKTFFIALFCLVAVCNCGPTGYFHNSPDMNSSPPPLSGYYPELGNFNTSETGWRIRRDFLDLLRSEDFYLHPILHANPAYLKSVHDVYVYKYYGTYNNFVVISMDMGMSSIEEIDGVYLGDTLITWKDIDRIIAWKDGRFYELKEVYDMGMWTEEDVESIAYYSKPGKLDRYP